MAATRPAAVIGAVAVNSACPSSPAVRETAQAAATAATGGGAAQPDESSFAPQGSEVASATGLTPEEEQIVAQLAATDRQVRAHEQAHLAAAAGLARGVSFSYTTGPDGKQYAVGGEVSIDTSPVSGDPAATIRKADPSRTRGAKQGYAKRRIQCPGFRALKRLVAVPARLSSNR